jgi:hypothetical protein
MTPCNEKTVGGKQLAVSFLVDHTVGGGAGCGPAPMLIGYDTGK